jgi:hypothetical protein
MVVDNSKTLPSSELPHTTKRKAEFGKSKLSTDIAEFALTKES